MKRDELPPGREGRVALWNGKEWTRVGDIIFKMKEILLV
jgi:hypothetical protein